MVDNHLWVTPYRPSSWRFSYVWGAVLESLSNVFKSESCSSEIATRKEDGVMVVVEGSLVKGAVILICCLVKQELEMRRGI